MKTTWGLLCSALALSLVLTLSHALLRAATAYPPLDAPWLTRVGFALFLYALVFFAYAMLLKYFDISILFPVYTALSIAGVSIVGIFYFGEALSLSKVLGLCTLLAGVTILSL